MVYFKQPEHELERVMCGDVVWFHGGRQCGMLQLDHASWTTWKVCYGFADDDGQRQGGTPYTNIHIPLFDAFSGPLFAFPLAGEDGFPVQLPAGF